MHSCYTIVCVIFGSFLAQYVFFCLFPPAQLYFFLLPLSLSIFPPLSPVKVPPFSPWWHLSPMISPLLISCISAMVPCLFFPPPFLGEYPHYHISPFAPTTVSYCPCQLRPFFLLPPWLLPFFWLLCAHQDIYSHTWIWVWEQQMRDNVFHFVSRRHCHFT